MLPNSMLKFNYKNEVILITKRSRLTRYNYRLGYMGWSRAILGVLRWHMDWNALNVHYVLLLLSEILSFRSQIKKQKLLSIIVRIQNINKFQIVLI